MKSRSLLNGIISQLIQLNVLSAIPIRRARNNTKDRKKCKEKVETDLNALCN